jgi:hypothetical protein
MRITPETKLGPLLDAHPELEEPLVALVPAFGKLKNPILRKTVASVATLEQAARVGGIPLPDLLAFLRERAGQAPAEAPAEPAAPSQVPTELPPWFQPGSVVLELDAAALLAVGEHPVGRIRQALAAHPAGATVVVTSAFEPAPLLELFRGEGILVGCSRNGEQYRTCLRKP